MSLRIVSLPKDVIDFFYFPHYVVDGEERLAAFNNLKDAELFMLAKQEINKPIDQPIAEMTTGKIDPANLIRAALAGMEPMKFTDISSALKNSVDLVPQPDVVIGE